MPVYHSEMVKVCRSSIPQPCHIIWQSLFASGFLGRVSQKMAFFLLSAKISDIYATKCVKKVHIWSGDRLYLCARMAAPWSVSSGVGSLLC
jgi:hypothetical protein